MYAVVVVTIWVRKLGGRAKKRYNNTVRVEIKYEQIEVSFHDRVLSATGISTFVVMAFTYITLKALSEKCEMRSEAFSCSNGASALQRIHRNIIAPSLKSEEGPMRASSLCQAKARYA